MYRFCVFDLDGTLVNTLADVTFAVNHTLEGMGLPVFTEDDYRLMIGDGVQKLCERVLPPEVRQDPEKFNYLLREYSSYYKAHCCDRSLPYDEIPGVLQSLRESGIPTALLSNKPQPQTDVVLANCLAGHTFLYARGQSDRFPRKPDPGVFFDCLKTTGFSAEETIYVGDSNVDVRFAHAAGVRCIGAAWGFRGEKELRDAGADYIAQQPADILSIISGRS